MTFKQSLVKPCDAVQEEDSVVSYIALHVLTVVAMVTQGWLLLTDLKRTHISKNQDPGRLHDSENIS